MQECAVCDRAMIVLCQVRNSATLLPRNQWQMRIIDAKSSSICGTHSRHALYDIQKSLSTKVTLKSIFYSRGE